jgi:hypothetical protein
MFPGVQEPFEEIEEKCVFRKCDIDGDDDGGGPGQDDLEHDGQDTYMYVYGCETSLTEETNNTAAYDSTTLQLSLHGDSHNGKLFM